MQALTAADDLEKRFYEEWEIDMKLAVIYDSKTGNTGRRQCGSPKA